MCWQSWVKKINISGEKYSVCAIYSLIFTPELEKSSIDYIIDTKAIAIVS